MSLTNKEVNIYSEYIVQPNTFSTFIIPPVGVPGGFSITLPKIYNNTLEVASFRITNYSTYNVTIKYIANKADDASVGGTGTLTTLTILSGGSKSSVTIDDVNQVYNVSDSSNSIDNSATYLPLTGGTIVGNLTVTPVGGTKSFAIDTVGSEFNGKLTLNSPGGAAPNAASDMDIYQSNNSDMTALIVPKTNGIRLYASGASTTSGIFYQLGVDSNGYLSLFKTNTGVTNLVCTFTPNGITGINQQLPSSIGSAGQLVGKGYVDNRFNTLIGSEINSTNTGKHTITLTAPLGNIFMIRHTLFTLNFASFYSVSRLYSLNTNNGAVVGYAFDNFMTAWNSNQCSILIYTGDSSSTTLDFQWFFNGAMTGYSMYIYV